MELGGEPVMWGSESQRRRRFKEKAFEAQEKGAVGDVTLLWCELRYREALEMGP